VGGSILAEMSCETEAVNIGAGSVSPSRKFPLHMSWSAPPVMYAGFSFAGALASNCGAS
jgi:hypothetical protein